MTTITSKKTGRKYEVRTETYGTRNTVQRLYFGGVFLATTGQAGPNGESSASIEDTLARADERADKLGIEVQE